MSLLTSHRVAYVQQAVLGPTTPQYWAFNPAYAQVQNEHVWSTAWADIMTGGITRRRRTRRSSGSRRSSRNTKSHRADSLIENDAAEGVTERA